MKALIVEDEVIAAQTLVRMIGQLRGDIEILAILQTVGESVSWFRNNPMPDLVFMDIHLADGSSFSIFEKVDIECPVIFTTAYNKYALEAFEVNGIDYLLKPINKTRLAKAIAKFGHISRYDHNSQIAALLMESLDTKPNRYKSHFLIPHKDKLLPLAVDDIAYVYAEFKVAKAITFDNRPHTLDYSLEELMRNLDPDRFFRVSRQYIVAHGAILDISIWFAGKLAVNLKVPVEDKIVVSKARVPDFKAWFTR